MTHADTRSGADHGTDGLSGPDASRTAVSCHKQRDTRVFWHQLGPSHRGARFENPATLKTIRPHPVSSARSQSLTEESEAGEPNTSAKRSGQRAQRQVTIKVLVQSRQDLLQGIGSGCHH